MLTLIFGIWASESPPGPGERLKRPGLIGLKWYTICLCYVIGSQMNGGVGGSMNHLPLLFCKSVCILFNFANYIFSCVTEYNFSLFQNYSFACFANCCFTNYSFSYGPKYSFSHFKNCSFACWAKYSFACFANYRFSCLAK